MAYNAFPSLDHDCTLCNVMQINEETELYIARVRADAGICLVSRVWRSAGYVTPVVAVPGVGCCMLLCAVYGNTGLDSVPVPAQPSPAQPSPAQPSPASTMWPPGHQEQCTPLCN